MSAQSIGVATMRNASGAVTPLFHTTAFSRLYFRTAGGLTVFDSLNTFLVRQILCIDREPGGHDASVVGCADRYHDWRLRQHQWL
jgi:hypothetical protein